MSQKKSKIEYRKTNSCKADAPVPLKIRNSEATWLVNIYFRNAYSRKEKWRWLSLKHTKVNNKDFIRQCASTLERKRKVKQTNKLNEKTALGLRMRDCPESENPLRLLLAMGDGLSSGSVLCNCGVRLGRDGVPEYEIFIALHGRHRQPRVWAVGFPTIPELPK